MFAMMCVLLTTVRCDMRCCRTSWVDHQDREGTMTDEVRILVDDVPDRILLKPAEVATCLRVSAKTIYRWCDMGLMESVKLNGSVRVLRASVVSFLRKGFTPSTLRNEAVKLER